MLKISAVSWRIALRYCRPGLHSGMSGLLSLLSLLGLVLGVFTLIVVTSVMNGFERELQQRLLSLLPHAQLVDADGSLQDWQSLSESLASHPGIMGVAPYVEATVMLSANQRMQAVQLSAIDIAAESGVSALPDKIIAGDFARLAEQPYGMVIGSLLARQLGLLPGDRVNMIIPKMHTTPMGPVVRQRSFEVVAVFEVGAELDRQVALVNLRAGQKMLAMGEGVSGLRVAVVDRERAQKIAQQAVAGLISGDIPHNLQVIDWKRANASLFRAVLMEKIMIFVLLLGVVAVASFNIVSIILMTVADKRSDIAVLRTMGADAGQVRLAFILQGLIIGTGGTIAGAVAGVLVAPNIGLVVKQLETWGGWQLFDPSVYFIPYLPSQLEWADVMVVVLSALVISLLATLYPASRAAKIAPAQALAYDH